MYKIDLIFLVPGRQFEDVYKTCRDDFDCLGRQKCCPSRLSYSDTSSICRFAWLLIKRDDWERRAQVQYKFNYANVLAVLMTVEKSRLKFKIIFFFLHIFDATVTYQLVAFLYVEFLY